jgi:hypothetical protein
MQSLLALVIIPLVLLNAFGGIASGIWLAVLGEWWALGYGLIGLLLSHFFLAFVLAPGLIILLAPAGILFEKQRPFLALPLLLLGTAYIYLVMTAWCLLAFVVFTTRADGETFWPLLIWSYGVALGPWVYMAQKEEQAGGGDTSAVATLCAQVAYVIMALVSIFGRSTLVELAVVFGAVMLLGMLVQTGIGFAL